jgi:hypothetical protein
MDTEIIVLFVVFVIFALYYKSPEPEPKFEEYDKNKHIITLSTNSIPQVIWYRNKNNIKSKIYKMTITP